MRYLGIILLIFLVSCSTVTTILEKNYDSITDYKNDTISSSNIGVVELSEPIIKQFNWTIYGKDYWLNTTLYDNISREQNNYETSHPYGDYENIDLQMTIRRTDESLQNEELNSIISIFNDLSKKESWSDDDAARSVISFVQHISYDEDRFNNITLHKFVAPSKYPYQVLLSQKGVCDEKSYLLAALLRKLDYNVSVFIFDEKPFGHASVGIACDAKYSYHNSGYCFVETTHPTIITYSKANYSNAGPLNVEPTIIPIGGTKKFDALHDYESSFQYEQLAGEDFQSYKQRLLLIRQYGLAEISCKNDSYLCNGQCWSACKDWQWFHCTISGGICYPMGNYVGDCPYGTNECNNNCYSSCGDLKFVCTNNGALCKRNNKTYSPEMVVEYTSSGKAKILSNNY